MKTFNEEMIPLKTEKPTSSVEIAKFIISNTYHLLLNYLNEKTFSVLDYSVFLNNFKKLFTKEKLEDKFSFDLLNGSNTDNFYKIKYKEFINIMNDLLSNILEVNFIKNHISFRNCLIFLEYLYLLLEKKPQYISHYIIKINICIIILIPKQNSKRIIDSTQLFYFNLQELKSIFETINYKPSKRIQYIEAHFYDNYLDKIKDIKKQKLFYLNQMLSNLLNTISKKKELSQIDIDIYDYIGEIQKGLTNDSIENINKDELIEKYINKISKLKKKKLCQISLDDIKQKKINYLYLIALNKYEDLDNTEKNENIIKEINENNEKEQEIVKKEKIIEKEEETKGEEGVKGEKEINKEEDVDIENESERIYLNMDKIKDDESIDKLKIENLKEEKNKYEEYINNSFLCGKIFDINKENIYDILCFLDVKDKFINGVNNFDNIFFEYKNEFIKQIKNKYCLDYEDFYSIIDDKQFYNDILHILESDSIKKYVTSKRFYEEITEKNAKTINIYQFEFAKDNEEFVENYANEYNELMKLLKDFNFFRDLFRLKFLPKGIRAYVDSNMKILINPLYYEFNQNIQNKNKKIILEAVFKILIVHEIMHILKFMKNNINFGEIPKTPRDREAGEMLINYLFGFPVIKNISLDEAKKINNINSWEKIEELRTIFKENLLTAKENNKIQSTINYNNNNIDHIDHISLYYTGEGINDVQTLKKVKKKIYTENDMDIDIN